MISLPSPAEFAKVRVPRYLCRDDGANWLLALGDHSSIVRMFFDIGRSYEQLCRQSEAYRMRLVEVAPGVFDRLP